MTYSALQHMSDTSRLSYQGSYTNLTVIFQTFPGRNYFFFSGLFKAFVHLYVNKNITKLAFKRWNFLHDVFFYSEYQMGLKFLNFELQMLCVINCKKINKCMGNQQCNRHLHFPGEHCSFRGFLQTFPYLWSFSRVLKALNISTPNSRTFHTFPGSVRTLSYGYSKTNRLP